MTAIVLNTLNGAVTEYSNFDFDSITPTHTGSAFGLYALGGDSDAGTKIVGQFMTPKKDWGSSHKKLVDTAFIGIKGRGNAELLVQTEQANTPYSYSFPILAAGESRAKAGRGIRENYLAFGLKKTDGKDFQVDRFEVVLNASSNRRTQ